MREAGMRMEPMEMTKLKERAAEMLLDIPDEKMIYVIDLLKWLNGLFNDKSVSFDNAPAMAPGISSEAFEAWERFKKYKGIIQFNVDDKAELARARDEKYPAIS